MPWGALARSPARCSAVVARAGSGGRGWPWRVGPSRQRNGARAARVSGLSGVLGRCEAGAGEGRAEEGVKRAGRK